MAGVCGKCGAAVAGNFCGECGHKTDAQAGSAKPLDQGWSGVAGAFLDGDRGHGIFAVTRSFLRHPVDTIIALTDDPSYRGHWGYLTAMVGAQLTLAHVLLPRLFSMIFHTPDRSDTSAVITSELVQYAGLVILTPIQYYLCRALGTLPRTPMAYVKLCVLSVSFGALVSIIGTTVFYATGALAMQTQTMLDFPAISRGFAVVSLLVILAFVTASHRRFWGMSWPIAIGVTVAAAALSWGVVYPGLASLAAQADIVGFFSHLFG